MKRQNLMCAIAALLILGPALLLSACGDNGPILPAQPSVGNLRPIALITQSPDVAHPGDTMVLDGSSSYDPEGEPLAAYAWSQIGGSSVTLSSTDGTSTSFVVPNETTTLTFALVVMDVQSSFSAAAEIDITVAATPPVDTPETINAVFVSANQGNDSNSGSSLHPVATINAGTLLAAKYGLTTIYVMEGTYNEAVTLKSGQTIKGCVVSVDVDGSPTFGTDNSKTIIKAPATSQYAVIGTSVHDVDLECLSIQGAQSGSGSSMGISLDSVSKVALGNLSFKTPGVAKASCRDVQIASSSDVEIFDSSFRNSGVCADYIGVSIDNSSDIRLVASSSGNSFAIASGGSEQFVKAVQATASSQVQISGADIKVASGGLSANTVFSGIVLGDVLSTLVKNNDISSVGGKQSAGVSISCTNEASDVNVEGNTINISDASAADIGVSINCGQPDGKFSVQENVVSLAPPQSQASTVRAIDATSLLRPITLSVINNVVSMPVVTNDQAAKTGMYLYSFGANSAVSAKHNNFLVTGKYGELHYLYSNRTNVQFSTFNDVIFIFGSNTKNAVFNLKSQCDTTYCAKDIVANLIDADMVGHPLPLAYYYDTAQKVLLAVANECDSATPPVQCTGALVSRSGNILQAGMQPSYFDFTTGALQTQYVGLVKDLGTNAGVTMDINGKARTDGHPDIGAYEY